MKTATRFTLEERKKLEELLKLETSLQSIARLMGRTRSGLQSEVDKFFQRSGLTIYDGEMAHRLSAELQSNKNKRSSTLTLEKKFDQVKELREQGYSIKDISKFLGTHYSAVFRFIKEKNIHAISGIYPINLEERISSLEMQIKILTNQIKELKNDKIH
jgi:IS30 family transposase